MAAAEHTAYTAIVPELPCSVVSGRKVAAMAIFENQLAQVEQVIPKSLPRNGWISAHSTHTTGPAEKAKATINSSTKAIAACNQDS